MREPDKPVQSPEQRAAVMRELARDVRAFHLILLDQGFDPGDAVRLAAVYLSDTLKAARSPGAADDFEEGN